MRRTAGTHLNYGRYLLRHKWYVFVEACRLGVFLRGLTHDLSKLRPDEWAAYADYFYGGHSRKNTPPAVQAAFDLAWLLHQKRNDHHWQFWVLREDSGATKVLPMPDACRRELLADWRGAGRAITGTDNTKDWWLQNGERMLLHEDTTRWLDQQLGVSETVRLMADQHIG